MSAPDSHLKRIDAYRAALHDNYRRDRTAQASYVLANLALEELKLATQRAEEPSDESLEAVAYRFDLAAEANDGKDQLASLRSRMLKAWIRPIVWSDIINIDALTSGEAKRVAQNIGLSDAADETAAVTMTALEELDDLDGKPKQLRTEAEQVRIGETVGFISEATPILLGARHATAKHFALPSLAYDDSISTPVSQHIDGIYFDNRKQRTKHRVPYQVETSSGWHPFIHKSIPVIDARQMGNLPKSSRWPSDDRSFMTARHLVTERLGDDAVDAWTSSRLDSIASAVFNKILHHR